MTRLAALLPCAVLLASEARAAAAPRPIPTDAQCTMPAARTPLSFVPGEELEYDLDALGAKAGTLVVRALASNTPGVTPVIATAETNDFFSKIRRVHGKAVSDLDTRSFRPTRYTEIFGREQRPPRGRRHLFPG